MFYDAALVFDPDAFACDLDIGADGDLVMDDTPATPMLMSIGLDRRAAADDELPAGRSALLKPASFSERRGSPGDALDPFGQKAGSRIWLLDRAKQTETTRQLLVFWGQEALAWAPGETGNAAVVDAEWRARGLMVWRAVVDDVTIALTQETSA